MDTLMQDLRYAVRSLGRARGFAAVAVLTLALGIGANSAIFTVVNGVLLRALPYAQPEQLVRVYNENRQDAQNSGSFSLPDFEDLGSTSGSVFSKVASYMYTPTSSARLSVEGRPELLPIAYVSGDFFEVLGVSPLRGRVIAEGDAIEGRDRVVVLSYSAWQNRFGADASIVGRTIRLNNEPFSVIGVMPQSFAYPEPEVELFAPVTLMGPNAVGPHVRDNRWLSVIARLQPGVTVTAATTATSRILGRLEHEYPESNEGWGTARVRELQTVLVGDVRPALLVLLGVVALVLLIACANLANLLLARSTTRVRDVAIRVAMGASRARIVRLVLTESVVLAVVGGIVGLGLSLWAVRVFVAMAGGTIPRAESIRPDLNVVLFTVALTLVTGVLFGLVPALRAASGAAAVKLREGGRTGTAGQERQRARNLLVMIESALAVILLVSAGLMVKSFYRLTQVDPGFRAENTVRVHISMPTEVFESRDEMLTRFNNHMRALFDAVGSVPGVVSVGASKQVPLQGGAEPYSFTLPGGAGDDVLRSVGAYIVTPGFFQALGVPLLRGREFDWNDATNGVIVSRTLAAKLWPGEEAVGKQLAIGSNPYEVIGVAGDVRNEGLATVQLSAVYVPFYRAPRVNQNLFVRVSGDPAAVIPALREAVWSTSPNQTIRSIETMHEMKSRTIAQPQFFMMLIAAFGALALTLAAIGMYGVISYTMRQRTAEIGVRMALGADAMQIYKLVVGKAMQLALAGVVAGVVGALLLTQLMRTLLFGVAPTDPLSIAVAALVLVITAFVAAFLPAWRAARIPPSVAFRAE